MIERLNLICAGYVSCVAIYETRSWNILTQVATNTKSESPSTIYDPFHRPYPTLSVLQPFRRRRPDAPPNNNASSHTEPQYIAKDSRCICCVEYPGKRLTCVQWELVSSCVLRSESAIGISSEWASHTGVPKAVSRMLRLFVLRWQEANFIEVRNPILWGRS